MLIWSYVRQLRDLASREKVDLLDAVKHAGLSRTTYYRSIEGDGQLMQSQAEKIAVAIRELGVG